MDFLPLDIIQKSRNELYYKKKGLELYNDFKTFGSSSLICYANAMEFYSFAKDLNDPVIYEFGVGNGKFAFFFLRKLKELDQDFFKRTKYYLCDISKKILTAAAKLNSFANVETVNGESLDIKIEKATYIRSNELYDDLPARMFVKKEKIYEIHYNSKLEKKYVECKENLNDFFKEIPENYEIPINFHALTHLRKCIKSTKGYIDIFDYGFYDTSEIKLYPVDMWNNLMVRNFNGQLTVDVNFLFLSKNIKKRNQVEWQQEYLENFYKKKFQTSEKDQLYYSSKKNDIEENYEYKHMRVFCE